MLEQDDLERFVDDYGDHAYNFAYNLCGNEPDAHELVQDSFVKIFDRAERYDSAQSLESWFMTIMKNLFLDGLRRCERRLGSSLDVPMGAEGLTLADSLADARETALLDRLENKEEIKHLRRALK